MRVQGQGSAGKTGGVRGGASRPTGGGFSLGAATNASEARPTARAEGAVGVGSVDALLALQTVGDPLERRRRATQRGGRLLDMLEDVKLGLLSGRLDSRSLVGLRDAIRSGREATGEAGLDDVLAHIETRAAVELAKLEARRAT